MNTRFVRWLAVGLVGGLLTLSAQAQGPEGGPGGFPGGPGGPGMMMMPMGGGPGGPGGPNLLSFESVQEDIKLTEKQKTQLKSLEASVQKKRREQPRPGDDNFDPQTMFESMNTLRRQQEAGTAKILDKTQKARIAEIELQREGLMAVANKKDVSAKLKLTSTQSKKIRTIMTELQQNVMSAMPMPPGGFGGGGPGGPGGNGGPALDGGPGVGGPGNGGPGGPGGRRPRGNNANANGAGGGQPGEGGPGGPGGPGGGLGGFGGPPDFNNPEMRAQFTKMRQTMEKARKTAAQKIEEVLTKDQRIAFETLQGKPFDVTSLEPNGPGGPGGPEGGPAGLEGRPMCPQSKRANRAGANANPDN